MRRRLIFPVALTFGVSVLSGCAGQPSAPKGITVTDKTVILDVRTAEEFATGHLDGAKNLDVTAGAVDAALGELDKNAEYVVYCRSGNRAGQAVEKMKAAGISRATNAGSLDEAAKATGLQIVR